MTKYIIQKTYVGTALNPNFAGDTQIYVYGKGGHSMDQGLSTYLANKYGFCCEAAAKAMVTKMKAEDEYNKKYCSYLHPEFWDVSYKILGVELNYDNPNPLRPIHAF